MAAPPHTALPADLEKTPNADASRKMSAALNTRCTSSRQPSPMKPRCRGSCSVPLPSATVTTLGMSRHRGEDAVPVLHRIDARRHHHHDRIVRHAHAAAQDLTDRVHAISNRRVPRRYRFVSVC
ncbi:MAG: hypothetical protein ABI868_07845 [Acidobacteriota bacterium]